MKILATTQKGYMVCLCVYMFIWVQVHMYMCVWRPKTISASPQMAQQVDKQGLSLVWSSPSRLSWPANEPHRPSLCLSGAGLSGAGITGMKDHTWLFWFGFLALLLFVCLFFNHGFWGLNSGPWQVFSQLSYLPSSYHCTQLILKKR